MKVAINQSIYLPWKGFFDLMAAADVFVLYDHVQFSKGSYRNRQQIVTEQGPIWLTVPVKKTSLDTPIDEVAIANPHWQRKHWEAITQAYSKAPYFADYRDQLAPLFLEQEHHMLSEMNEALIRQIAAMLGITTPIHHDSEFNLGGDRVDKLVQICQTLGADTYLSGPGAQGYLELGKFHDAGVEVSFLDYAAYPEYPQLYEPFTHGVSVLDLLFNTGSQAPLYMQHLKK